MVTLPPPQSQQQQDLYRHPPYDMYQGHPQHVPYPPNPHDPHRDPQHAQMNFSQPAPRQRTAIACRYCRRRKVSGSRVRGTSWRTDEGQIRCHGFDSSPDGRCTNCIRFHQECIFTPVSSQAHAFVPAHTAYPHLRNTGRIPQHPDGRPMYAPPGQPVLYGAHGQPLGPILPQGQDPNYPPPPQSYGPGPYPGPMYDDRGPPQPGHPPDQVSRKRPRVDEPSHPAVPPPAPPQGSSSHPYPQQQRLSASTGGRRESQGGSTFEYPDPTHIAPVSPASSTTSYQSTAYPPTAQQQPYYPSQPSARRSSPQSSYSFEARASGSPHGSTSSATTFTTFPPGLHPPQVLPPTRESGRSTPPGAGAGAGAGREGTNSGNGSRAGMSVRDLLGPGDGQGGRTSADSDMLKALTRRGM